MLLLTQPHLGVGIVRDHTHHCGNQRDESQVCGRAKATTCTMLEGLIDELKSLLLSNFNSQYIEFVLDIVITYPMLLWFGALVVL